MKILQIIFLCLITTSVYAQFPSELWHEGKVVLINQDTLEGTIKYDLDKDIIQLSGKGKIEAYTSRNVLYFSILDTSTKRFRQFYALPYNEIADFNTPRFFELFYEGKLTLLAREYITIQTSNFGPPGLSGSSYSRQVLAYDYYFLRQGGSIVLYRKNKKELLLNMRKYENEMKSFIKRNRLHIDQREDLIQIFDHYNSLIK